MTSSGAPSLWSRKSIPTLQPRNDNTIHPPKHFCPDWKVNLNDRADMPVVAREMSLKTVLPRDDIYLKSLSSKELLSDLFTAKATYDSFFAEAASQFETAYGTSGRLEELKKKLEEAEKTEAKYNEAQVRMKSLHAEVKRSNKRNAELEEQLKNDVFLAKIEGQEEGRAEYLKSDEFRRDLKDSQRPVYAFGYTTCLGYVRELYPDLDLSDLEGHPTYNLNARKLVNLVLNSFQEGKKASLVLDEYNKILTQTAPEGGAEGGDSVGKGKKEEDVGESDEAGPEQVVVPEDEGEAAEDEGDGE